MVSIPKNSTNPIDSGGIEIKRVAKGSIYAKINDNNG